MELSLAVFVSQDKREHCEVLLPGISAARFRGTSLARLLDDVALHLMEHLPKEQPLLMERYAFNPQVELRKVKVEVQLPSPDKRKDGPRWSGRISVVLTRWPEERFWVAHVPRLMVEGFAVESPGALPQALARVLEQLARDGQLPPLEQVECRYQEHLEILSFDAEYPTLLPSQPIRREKKKRKKRKAEDKSEAREREKKRVLVPPAVLQQVGRNLTHAAMDGRLGRAYLRDGVVGEVCTQLTRPGTAILLVGPSGVGKTALVHEVVRRLAQASSSIQDRHDVWQVDGNRIIAGMSVVGAWEQRVGRMVEELSLRRDVLFVTDLPALVYTGRSAHSDTNVAEYLEPHLARGELRLIGECTPERLAAVREEAPGFFARFRVIEVPPMSESQALLVLAHALREAARLEPLAVEPAALETVLALVRRFEANRAHPGKAISLFHRVLADHQSDEKDDLERRVVTRQHVIEHYGRHAGLPSFVLWQKEARTARAIAEFFEHRIVAQPAAVEAATDVVLLLEQGLNDPSRPIATFLFVGPTGVGKTETAKALAELLFGSGDRLVRFDMSEMMSPYSVARLFGDRQSPDGELTRRIQQQPFSVVLLDEIEKAHPSVFDALLQVLGEGRMTNAHGQTVDFASTVIIMTSNLGVREAQHLLGFDAEQTARHAARYREAAERYFRPEFFNRIDRVVPFAALSRESLAPLVQRLLEQMLSRRGLTRSNVVVEVEPELVEVLVEQGFDPRYGARSIKRALEQRLAVPLAEELVKWLSPALSVVALFAQGGELGLSVQRPPSTLEPALELVPPSSWAEAASRHRQVLARLPRIRAALGPLEEERGPLLERYNRRQLAPEQQERLEWLTAVLEDARALEERVVDFGERHLELVRFRESVHIDERSPDKRWYKRMRRILVPEVVSVSSGLGALREGPKRELLELEEQAAALLYRLRAGDEAMLLRLDPVGASEAAQRFVATRAAELEQALARLSRLRSFRKLGGAWSEGLTSEQQRQQLQACALLASGPGVRGLLAGELGLHLSAREWGASRALDLLRVWEVDGRELEALAQSDRQMEAERAGARWAEGQALVWRAGEPPPEARLRARIERRVRAWEAEDA